MPSSTPTINPGPTSTQPVVPAGQLTPADIQAIVEQLTPIQARFRQASTFLQADLDQKSFTLTANTTSAAGKSVGLAVRLITEWNITVTVANAVTTTQTVNVSPLFPWNFIANTNVSINGGAATYSSGGIQTLSQMLRFRKVARLLTLLGGQGYAIDPALYRTTLGSNLTASATAGVSDRWLSGIKTLQAAASASSLNTIAVVFYTFENLVLSKDSLLGALPLQNQSTSVAVNRQIVSSITPGTRNDYSAPFYTTNANLTLTLTTCTADTTYEFASVPQDPSLYLGIIRNAFEFVEQPNKTVSTTGVKALDFGIPINKYIVALHMFLTDSSGVAGLMFDSTNGLGNQYLQYNAATVTPITRHAGRQRADAFLTYGDDPAFLPGVRIWDGEDSADNITESDNMMWLNTYAVADPHLFYDVGSSFSTTGTFSTAREAIVRGAVTTIGQ
jgi:hypothetical protein